MSKKYWIWMLTMFLCYQGFAQLGGQRSFEFLNVPGSARMMGLGGVNVSLNERDVNFFLANPALVGDSLAGNASVSYQFYLADIGQASFAYAHKFKVIGTLSFGVQHMGYGEITGYDDTGLEIGSFKSGETALVIGKSHQIGFFKVAANLKAVFSSIAGFHSSAMMVDIGGTFVHPNKRLTIGMVIKNFGFVLSEYSETSSTHVPFDVQVRVTFKPEHMPLRFSLTGYNLATAGDVYDNPADDQDDPGSFDKFLQHINLGTEILLHRNVNILLAYNFLRGQELKTENSGGSGLSVGAAINMKGFEFVFSRSSYSTGQGAYALTLAANIQNMIFKKKKI